jgi:excisionase family DNA binding protein
MAVLTRPAPTTTIKEAANRLGVHENTIRNWMDRHILQSYRLPSGHRRLPETEVERIEQELFGVPASFPEVETTRATFI